MFEAMCVEAPLGVTAFNYHNWMPSHSRCNLQNFESVHALGRTGAECLFVVWGSMLVVLVVSILGWSVLAVDDAGVVVQCIP
ncbi:hypothetical protein TNCV_3971281 [Trichonephila clavipes]|nr:hypothetical protein TNCV_3971281 [Trichonephila clavipes]